MCLSRISRISTSFTTWLCSSLDVSLIVVSRRVRAQERQGGKRNEKSFYLMKVRDCCFAGLSLSVELCREGGKDRKYSNSHLIYAHRILGGTYAREFIDVTSHLSCALSCPHMTNPSQFLYNTDFLCEEWECVTKFFSFAYCKLVRLEKLWETSFLITLCHSMLSSTDSRVLKL